MLTIVHPENKLKKLQIADSDFTFKMSKDDAIETCSNLGSCIDFSNGECHRASNDVMWVRAVRDLP
jgi:hypothetical protein